MNDAGQQRKPRPSGGGKDVDTDEDVKQVDPGSTSDIQQKLKEAMEQEAKKKRRVEIRRRSCCCC